MKFLKKFESNHIGFTELHHGDYHKIRAKSKFVDFNSEELRKLKSIFYHELSWPWFVDIRADEPVFKVTITKYTTASDCKSFVRISKFDDDYYYVVFNQNVNNDDESAIKIKFFLCDELSGLTSCVYFIISQFSTDENLNDNVVTESQAQNSNVSFKKVDRKQIIDMLKDINVVRMSNEEKERLRQLLGDLKEPLISDEYGQSLFLSNKTYGINKAEDDWYFVTVRHYDNLSEYQGTDYYICDEWDGLEAFFAHLL